MTNELEVCPGGQEYFVDVTYAQANAGGGAIVIDIRGTVGSEWRVTHGRVVNSGTNGLQVLAVDGTASPVVSGKFNDIASAAGTKANLPSVPGGSTTSDVPGDLESAIFCGIHGLRITQTAAGAQNDTMRILLYIRRTRGDLPTFSKAQSTNPADVSVTAGAASFTVI